MPYKRVKKFAFAAGGGEIVGADALIGPFGERALQGKAIFSTESLIM